jgi:DNA modification methylase
VSSVPYTLHLGDCREVLSQLDDNSVDSIVTDPPYELGFMGKSWDASGIANNSGMWSQCLRVLKPGGHLLAFSGSRTYHRMVCAIEDGGFEIRDQIMWIYGSGFPKSHNLGDGRGTALKPAHEPICVARKPFKGTVAANVLEHGTGALNIDVCRVPTGDKLGGGGESAESTGKFTNEGWQRPWMSDPAALERMASTVRANVEKAEALGRWPANVIHDGSDEVVEAFPAAPGQMANASVQAGVRKSQNVYGAMNRAHELSADRVYADQGGTNFAMKPGARRLDTGSAARFFYCAKASRADRNDGLQDPGAQFKKGTTLRAVEVAAAAGELRGNTHPTVKPTALIAYLCRLVTPPGGVVLDHFMGSGSTGKACMLEGFGFVGIDMTPEYVDIARARIDAAWRAAEAVRKVCAQQDLFAEQL